jgi:hypothetical protein
MADTKHAPAHNLPTEGDGVSYRGIVWFIVILTVTTLSSQLLMWGLFRFLDVQAVKNDAVPAPLSVPFNEPTTVDGRVVPGTSVPMPTLLISEPANLKVFRDKEDEILATYGWMDKNAGTVRIPIDRAKDLLLQRGIPGGVPMTPAPAAPPIK